MMLFVKSPPVQTGSVCGLRMVGAGKLGGLVLSIFATTAILTMLNMPITLHVNFATN